MALLYSLIIILDGVFVMWLNVNIDYIFLLYSYVVGLIILVNIVKAKNIGEVMVQGRGLIMYDLMYVILLAFVEYGLPAIY